MKKLKVGIVCAGAMAKTLNKMEGFQMTAIASLELNKAIVIEKNIILLMYMLHF